MFSPRPTSRSGRVPSNAGTTSGSGRTRCGASVDDELALQQRLADEPEVEVLQVAQAAVDELGRAADEVPDGEVGALDQRDAVAARGGVERDAGAGDPAADHDARRTARRASAARASARGASRQVRYGVVDRGAARAGSLSCRGGPRWIRPSTRSPSGDADRGAALGRAQHRRACASSRRARARARRAARCRSPPRRPRRSSSSLHRIVAGAHRAEATTSVGARSSLAAASGPGRLLERRERLRAEHAEAPRVGQVVVRRPAGELEQLLERLAVDRLGRVGLVRAARADRRVDVHRG